MDANLEANRPVDIPSGPVVDKSLGCVNMSLISETDPNSAKMTCVAQITRVSDSFKQCGDQ
jgi:hypothetical protein